MVRGPCPVCHPSWVVALVLQNLLGVLWNPSRHTSCAVLRQDALFILASALGDSMLCLFLAVFPGARLWCPLLSSQVLCSSVCGLYCTGPTNARQSQWETVISCAGGQGLPGLLWLRIVSDACRSLLPHGVTGRSYRRPLSPSSSGCRCHGSAASRPQNGLFRVR